MHVGVCVCVLACALRVQEAPGSIPRLSRQAVVDIVRESWLSVDHARVCGGRRCRSHDSRGAATVCVCSSECGAVQWPLDRKYPVHAHEPYRTGAASPVHSQVARIGYEQTGPRLPEGSDAVYRDLETFWHELDGDALRVAAFHQASDQQHGYSTIRAARVAPRTHVPRGTLKLCAEVWMSFTVGGRPLGLAVRVPLSEGRAGIQYGTIQSSRPWVSSPAGVCRWTSSSRAGSSARGTTPTCWRARRTRTLEPSRATRIPCCTMARGVLIGVL